MMKLMNAGALVFFVLLAGPAVTILADAQGTALMTVVDRQGNITFGLTASDVSITLDGEPRRVLAVQETHAPAAIVIVIDGYTESGALAVRRALASILDAAAGTQPETVVSMVTGDAGRSSVFEHVVHGRAGLDRQVSGFVRSGSSSPLLESVRAAVRALSARPDQRRYVFVLTSQAGSAPSSLSAAEAAADLRRAGVSAWAVQTSRPTSRMLDESEVFLRKVTRESGGRQLLTATPAYDTAAATLVRQMLAQYLVTFETQGNHRGVLRIGVRREGIEVFAPGWFDQSSPIAR